MYLLIFGFPVIIILLFEGGSLLNSLLEKLPVWQQNHISVCKDAGLFDNARVLEVGGCTDFEITKALGAKSWYCVDPIRCLNKFSENENYKYFAESILTFSSDEKFDLIFATNSFEHIKGLDVGIANMYSLLKNGGKLSALLGPIWSSYKGHHLWYRKTNGELISFNNVNLPNWVHLLYSEDEIAEMLLPVYGKEDSLRISNLIFHTQGINRLFYDDYKEIVNNSMFKVLEFRDWHKSEYPSEDLQKTLEKKHSRKNFSTVSIKLLLEK